ncbi:CATSPER1, partial [Symbiodinium necroappetens]
ACERGRRWPAALALFAELAAKGADDVVALNAVLGALAGQWRLALLLASPRMSMAMEGTYHAILGALETSSRWWQAMHLFHAGSRTGRCGIVGLNSACSSLEKASKWELVLGLVHGSVGRDAISCTALLAACSRAMRWQQALAFREATGLLGAALLSAAAQVAGAPAPTCMALSTQAMRDAAGVLIRQPSREVVASRAGAAEQERALAFELLPLAVRFRRGFRGYPRACAEESGHRWKRLD